MSNDQLPPDERPPLSDLLNRLIDEEEAAADDPAHASEKESASPPDDAPPDGTRIPPAADFGRMGALLGNPELLRLLPALLGAMNGRQSAGQPSGVAGRPSEAGQRTAAGTGGRRPPDRHTALLCAVKPYLCPRRQQAVDSLVQVCRVRDAVREAGAALPLMSVPSSVGHAGQHEPPAAPSGHREEGGEP